MCKLSCLLTLITIQVGAGELPMNHEITYQLQDIFNLLPDVTNPVFVRSLQVGITTYFVRGRLVDDFATICPIKSYGLLLFYLR